MIGQTLQFIRDTLSQFIKNRFALDEDNVVLNCVVDASGAIPVANQNKMVISLINVEQETAKPFYNRNPSLSNGNYSDTNPSEKYYLDLLLSANFDDYQESLKFLNAAILFFQINPWLDSSSSSAIPAGLSKLEFDIEKISYHQMHSLWTAIGAKYQPSVIYKTRLITIQGNEADGFTPSVTKHANNVHA